MVFKNSISNTRKFFQKTIQNFKSFFSNNATYHKLPKTPNHHHHHHHPNPTIITSSSSIHNQFQSKPRENVTKARVLTKQPRRQDKDSTLFSKPKVDFICRKLDEMEKMVNDEMIRDEEHVLDVREFLHCYSRLRYTAYLDVVEQFFMEVYSDFFSTQSLKITGEAWRSRHGVVVGDGSYGGHKY